MTSKRLGVTVTVVLLLSLIACAVWDQTRTFDTPAKTSIGYEPIEGDIIFQSLPWHELTEAIEGSTGSPYSHVGVVALDRGRWVVIEAIGPTIETPLEKWIDRGRHRKAAVYRLQPKYTDQIPAFIDAARDYLGRPYDTRYRMDDEAIYCSELVYKAFQRTTGEPMGELVKLGDLNWQPYIATIRKYEGGDPPLDRQMITPRDLAKAEQLELVFDNGIKK